MELMALLVALRLAIKDPEEKTIIISDSHYAISCITNWAFNWANRGWTRDRNQPIQNLEIIKEAHQIYRDNSFNISIQKVPGHQNIFGNELADKLAQGKQKEFEKLLKLDK